MLTPALLIPLAAAVVLGMPLGPRLSVWLGRAFGIAGVAAVVPLVRGYQPLAQTWQFVERRPLGGGAAYAAGVDGLAIATLLVLACVVAVAAWIAPRVELGRDWLRILGFLLHASIAGVVVATDLAFLSICWMASLVLVLELVRVWSGPGTAVSPRLTVPLAVAAVALLGGVYLLHAHYRTATGVATFDLVRFLDYRFPADVQRRVWILWAIGVAALVPLPPLHGWTRAAVLGAPFAGVLVVLAAVLKLGLFFVLRVMLPLLPEPSAAFAPATAAVAAAAAVLGLVMAWRDEAWRGAAASVTAAYLAASLALVFRLTPDAFMAGMLMQIDQAVLMAVAFAIAAAARRVPRDGGGVKGPRFALAVAVAVGLAGVGIAVAGARATPAFLETSAGRVLARVRPELAPLVKQPSDCGAPVAGTPSSGAPTGWIISTPCLEGSK